VQYACPLLTRNVRDFEDIPGLDLVSYQLVLGKRQP
jgi:predicted nucleic acid-binding protein